MYAKAESECVRARSLARLAAIAAALVVSVGLATGTARASVDLTSKVDVRVLVRPAAAFGSGEDFVLRDGSVLRSGDGVQLRLGSDVDAYVYIIAYGSSNSAILLHPFSAKPKDALIGKGHTEIIPGDGVFLPLDGREGRETLFSIVSDVPLMDIGELLPRIEAHGDDLPAITAMISSAYPRAQRLTFKHIAASPLVGVAPRAEPAAGAASGTQAGVEVSPSLGSGSLLPPAGGGWSVPSTQDFRSADTPGAAGTTAAIGAGAATSTQSAPEASATDPARTAGAAAQASPTASASSASRDDAVQAAAVSSAAAASASAAREESPALEKARRAAGIDEHQFRGILATLPGSGDATVPEGMRKPYEEQGVLGGQGTRIRALGGSASAGWPSNDTPSKTQN